MPVSPGSGRSLPDIPVADVREGGPVEHARLRKQAMLDLRNACLSVIPAPLRGTVGPLDRISAAWLRRTASPYVDEIAQIAAIAGRPGVWFVNASYEWGCTARVDVEPDPVLRRTLDWPFPGLGRHVEVAVQDGGAGPYANVTWPGAAGVLTALAPGRFAAAINQAPLFRRGRAAALLPVDFLLNGVATWRRSGFWPAAHLLRHAFDTCRSFDQAVALLSKMPLAKPALFSIVGSAPGEGCLIERTETGAALHHGSFTIANDWHPSGPRRTGVWIDRGIYMRGLASSGIRCAALGVRNSTAAFGWLEEPVLNGLTRLAVEAHPASGRLSVVGFEPSSRTGVSPVTRVIDAIVDASGEGRHLFEPT